MLVSYLLGDVICIGMIRAYPGSIFVAAHTLAKWKKLEPNEITFSQGFSQKVVLTSCFVFNSLSVRGDFCCLLITFANSLDPDHARKMSARSGSKMFYPDGIEKSSIQRVKYGTIIKCGGIVKAMLENPKADQNTLFRKYVIFERPRMYF